MTPAVLALAAVWLALFAVGVSAADVYPCRPIGPLVICAGALAGFAGLVQLGKAVRRRRSWALGIAAVAWLLGLLATLLVGGALGFLACSGL